MCTGAHYYLILNPTANTVILHRDLPSKPSKDLLYRLLCWLWSTDTVMVDSVTLLGRILGTRIDLGASHQHASDIPCKVAVYITTKINTSYIYQFTLQKYMNRIKILNLHRKPPLNRFSPKMDSSGKV